MIMLVLALWSTWSPGRAFAMEGEPSWLSESGSSTVRRCLERDSRYIPTCRKTHRIGKNDSPKSPKSPELTSDSSPKSTETMALSP